MKHGVAPTILASQVTATAAWALEGDAAVARTFAAQTIRDAARVETAWKAEPAGLDYLRLCLSAHYLTVGTFCPTDVDARIRHHLWAATEDPERLARAVDEVDAIAALDPRLVSARVLSQGAADADRSHTYSGHDGEWFSVRAGALGRALALGEPARATRDRLEAAIEAELEREATMFQAEVRAGDMIRVLSAATILAHNTGDLSRVVDQWPKTTNDDGLRKRYTRLGHEADRARFGGAFFMAGAINKSLMAIENHRFFALREAKALRVSRDLLLPIGPFFYDWGMKVARAIDDEQDRASVVDALLETHLSRVEQQGVLRAIAGMVEAGVGSWDKLCAYLPARLRKVATVGAVPAAIKTSEKAFLARIENRYRVALREAEAAR